MPKSVQFFDGGVGLHSASVGQDSDINAKNIDNIKDSNISVKNQKLLKNSDISLTNTDVFKNTDMSMQNIERDAYIQDIKREAIELYKNELLRRKLAQQTQTTESVKTIENTPNTVSVADKKYNSKAEILQTTDKPTVQNKTVKEDASVWKQWQDSISDAIMTKYGKTHSEDDRRKGLICNYSFKVDNNRRITDIKVSVAGDDINRVTLDYENDVKYVIQSLNGSPILEYPTGSQKKIVSVSQKIIEEEVIDWNQWRANVTNAVIDKYNEIRKNDGKSRIGLVCNFDFKVDNNRQVSDIKVSVVNQDRNSVTISFENDVKLAIQKLNGTQVFEYPVHTLRQIVTVDEAVKIINPAHCNKTVDCPRATASWYNDYEKIRREVTNKSY